MDCSELHRAIERNQVNRVGELLQSGASVNDMHEGHYPLTHAAVMGHAEIVRLLLEHGANVMQRASNDATALHCTHDVKSASVLIDAGADVNAPLREGGPKDCSLLGVNASYGRLTMVRFLIEHGADVNGIAWRSRTPLHVAAENGHWKVVQYLLAHGASVNPQEENGLTPLMEAVRGRGPGRLKTVNVLIRGGADLEIASRGNTTALLWACSEGSVDIVKAIIDAGADINVRDIFNFNALTEAVEAGRADLIVPLLQAGVDPQVRISDKHAERAYRGRTPKELADYLKRRKIVKVFKQHGV
jgi:ankyrin repeat protein